MERKIERLKWDSSFFNLNIGKLSVEGDEKTDNIEEELIEATRLGSYDIVYVFSPIPLNTSDTLQLVDQKRTYINYNPPLKEKDRNIKDYIGEPELLYSLAYQAGHKSRFRIDKNFTEEDFRKLYRIWTDNSVKRLIADYVKVYEEDGKILGFVTAKQYKEVLSIGLIAVERSKRSRGIGSKLITEICNLGVKKDLAVEVVTQADNFEACCFYEKNYFTIHQEMFIYHIWNK